MRLALAGICHGRASSGNYRSKTGRDHMAQASALQDGLQFASRRLSQDRSKHCILHIHHIVSGPCMLVPQEMKIFDAIFGSGCATASTAAYIHHHMASYGFAHQQRCPYLPPTGRSPVSRALRASGRREDGPASVLPTHPIPLRFWSCANGEANIVLRGISAQERRGTSGLLTS